MESKTVNAANNPDLANKLASDAMKAAPQEEQQETLIRIPSEVVVDLPGGYISPDGEVYRTAEVRELTGKDEEAIIKTNNFARAISTMVSRATVKIGDVPATDDILEKILIADRDVLVMGIYRATFGDSLEVKTYCETCEEDKTAGISVTEDIPITYLEDPLEDREITVKGRRDEYTVILPENRINKELMANSSKTIPQLDTLLLEYCVTKINGRPTMGKSQIENIGLADRKLLLKTIIEKTPGPKFDDIKVECPDCGGEVVVPISIGSLFRI
jgi:hypothetical protein